VNGEARRKVDRCRYPMSSGAGRGEPPPVGRRGMLATAVMVALVLAGCAGDEPTDVEGVILEDVEGAEDHAPLRLGAATSAVGVSHRFEDGGVEVGSGQVLETDPVRRHLVADLVLEDGRAGCVVRFVAPSDRGLAATGTMQVDVVVEGVDGGVERTEVGRVDLGFELEPGGTRQVAMSSTLDLDTMAVRAVWCEARTR